LESAGVAVTKVEQLTQFPEMVSVHIQRDFSVNEHCFSVYLDCFSAIYNTNFV
jgi:hypothetical protein